MANQKSDPTKDPDFQKVVQTFLKTPHKPHKPLSKKKSNRKRLAKMKKSD
jgi:hypothetical protein